MEQTDGGFLFNAQNGCIFDRRGHANGLPGQAPLAKKVVGAEQGYHRFLSLLGDNRQFDLALLDLQNCVRRITLRENRLLPPVLQDVFPLAHASQE
jgi:hypothetical protein